MAIEDDEKELDRLLQVTAINQGERDFLRAWLRRGASPSQTEAIKLIADWCKWCTTIEVAMIAAIGAFFKAQQGGSELLVILACVSAIVCFTLSTVLAAAIFSSLPEATQHIHPGQSVWTRKAHVFGRELPMGTLALWQLGFFLLGLVAFATGVGTLACRSISP